MTVPLILAVDDDPALLPPLERELLTRYELDYQVRCLHSAADGLTALEEMAAAGEDVALVLAAEELTGTGTAFLGEVGHFFPHAQRALVIGWGHLGVPDTGDAIFEAIARGRIDHYVGRPAAPPDEAFHQAMSTFLLAWAENRRRAPHTIEVVGESWSGRAFQLREVLGRCAMPHRCSLAESEEGRAILADVGPLRFPMLVMPTGDVMEDPSDADIGGFSGAPLDASGERYDLVIVGCGPAGLSAGVYGASEGLRTVVSDSGSIGGQATSSSSIRNYLGFPRGVTGADLARRAYQQAWLFGARFAFMQRVTDLTREDDGIAVGLHTGGLVKARAVVLATGVSYRRLGVPALEELHGAGVFYGAAAAEAPMVAGEEVYIVGGANPAGQAAIHLANYAKRVTLVVRATSLEAGMSHYLVRQVEGTPNIDVRTGAEIVGGGGDCWLDHHLVLRNRANGDEEKVDAYALFLMIGAPAAHRVAAAGHRARSWGVLAAGDVRHGSIKRVASAVGEGSIAIQFVHRLLDV